MNRPDAIFTDLDGTLLGPDKKVGKQDAAAIRRLKELGIPVIICTGRPILGTRLVTAELGLGLPLCQRIAREHGGSLALASEEGKGTTVTVSLPNRRGHQRLGMALPPDMSGGFDPMLVELSDALPKQAFMQKYLD